MKNHTGFKLLLVRILKFGIYLIIFFAQFYVLSKLFTANIIDNNYLAIGNIACFFTSYFITKKINVSKYI